MPKSKRVVMSLACTVFVGCSWLRADTECTEGSTSCAGDKVRECVVDAKATANGGKPVMHWQTAQTCGTDEQLGRYTCGMVQGRATCVQASDGRAADGGTPAGGTKKKPWLRVDVSRGADGGIRIDGVEEVTLSTSPVEASWGEVAAISTDGSDVVDATLVPFPAEGETGTSVWLEGENADRISVVTSDGTEVAAVEKPDELDSVGEDAPSTVDPGSETDGSDGESDGVSEPDVADEDAEAEPNDGDERTSAPLDDAIEMGLPPGVRIRVRGASSDVPTAAMSAAVDAAFARIPMQLAYQIRELILSADGASEAVAPAEPRPFAASSNGAPGELAPLVISDATEALFQAFSFSQSSWVLDVRGEALRTYALDTTALSRDIARGLAAGYAKKVEAAAIAEFAAPFVKLPTDFPQQILEHLRNHLGPLLAAGETLLGAWKSLHDVATDAKLAYPYGKQKVSGALGIRTEEIVDRGAQPPSAEEAVARGFASISGFVDAESDFVEYVTAALVPERWAARPCEALRAQALDELPPALLVHVSKLVALRGLGLLGGPQVRACTGALRIASPDVAESGGIVLHKPDGGRIVFTNSLEGIRQPYFDDEMQLSWKADREYAGLSVSAGFKGAPPGVLRFAAGSNGNEDVPINRALLAFTNPDGYQTSIAKGGLLTIDAVRRDALSAFGLMVVLSTPQAGTKIYPLVSAQVKKPVWGDAP